MLFKIISIDRSTIDTVKVRVEIDAKEWTKIKNKRDLGFLYGVDISNEVTKHGVKGYNPTVSDRDRASKGIKHLTLWYTDTEWVPVPDNVICVDFTAKRKIA